MIWYYQLVLWLCCHGLLDTVHGYSTGATTDTCGNMRPQHGVPGRATPPPYTVTTNKQTYRAFEDIEVTISGTEVFTGFLLQAVSTDRSTHVGFFRAPGNTDVKTIGCGEGDAMTNAKKLVTTSSITVTWKAPAQTVGNIQMMATVVKNVFTFWVKIPSDILREVLPTLPPNFPGGTGTTPAPGGNPGICQPEDTGFGLAPITAESYTVKWIYLPCSNPPEVEFDITASVSDTPFTSNWVAIGFSKDEFMGDDSVIECLQVQNNQVAFRASYNEPGVKNNVIISGTNIGLVPLSATVGNGRFNCRFRRAVSVPSDPRVFDLSARKYRLLVARGVTNGDTEKIAHSVVYKSSPVVSSEFISFEKSGYLKTMK